MKEDDIMNVEKKKFKLRMPHTFVLLFCIAIVAGLLTYVIPAGTYDRIDFEGRQIVDAATYHAVDATPATLFQVLKAFPKRFGTGCSNRIFYLYRRRIILCRTEIRSN